MATWFEITVDHCAEAYARQATAAAFRELDRLEGELSRYVESSDIARANHLGPGESLAIGDDGRLECLLLAAGIAAATGRAFDPAYASAPGPTGSPAFTLDPEAHLLTARSPRLHLDLGAVCKGYALDRMAAVLAEWELHSACLNSGGSTALLLKPPAGESGWPVRIGEGAAARQRAHAMRTSGSGLAVKGEHLVDPRTGHVAARRARAWAVAPDAATADALSTAFFRHEPTPRSPPFVQRARISVPRWRRRTDTCLGTGYCADPVAGGARPPGGLTLSRKESRPGGPAPPYLNCTFPPQGSVISRTQMLRKETAVAVILQGSGPVGPWAVYGRGFSSSWRTGRSLWCCTTTPL